MVSKIEKKINSCEWLLTDGATGTNLFDMGLMSGDAPELWNEKYPEKIIKLHKDAIDAGSDLFLTNSLLRAFDVSDLITQSFKKTKPPINTSSFAEI